MGLPEHVVDDYRSLRLSLKAHPVSFLRDRLAAEGVIPNARLAGLADGARVKVSGLVLVRQRPGTASGVIFATLEDEGGIANTVIWPKVFERFRAIVMGASLVAVEGKLQKEGLVIHVIADRLIDKTAWLADLATPARDLFDPPYARADEVKRPGRDPRDSELGRHPRNLRLFRSRDFH